ncbi:MAG TPA: hypothetical protein VK157_02660 [Phycisphaerales bacterium]|nr:hypothetical protein [Phycisphaerales bacterium]
MQRLLIAFGILFLLASLPLAILSIVTGLKDGHAHCCYTDMLITPEAMKALDSLGVTNAQLETYLLQTRSHFTPRHADDPKARWSLIFNLSQKLVPEGKALYVQKVRLASTVALLAAAISFLSGVLLLTNAWHNNRLHRNFMHPRSLA